jgi:hypothetical protein
MRKFTAVITAILLTGLCLLSGCSFITGATSDNIGTRLDLSTITWSQRIFPRHLHTSNTSILISGTTDLPEGTVIRSQLYENYILLTWWPSDREYVIEDGEWEIKVLFEETGPHDDFIPESGYWLIIRVKNDPSIVDGVFWDTVGPPAVKDN